MKMDPKTKLWIMDDPKQDNEVNDDEEDNIEEEQQANDEKNETLNCKCVLSIKFNNHGEYLKWKKYAGDRQWDFLVNYPAIVRAEYILSDVTDVNRMVNKIIHLLHMGFDVGSASWTLIAKNSTP